MLHLHNTTHSPFHRWDGDRVLFEIADGGERVPCAISWVAPEDIGERRLFKPSSAR